MPDWSLLELHDSELKDSIAGYAVYDALGVRLGHVSGWVVDADHDVRMLKVTVSEWTDPAEYLVPIGAITLIGDTKSVVQLRELTKQTIARQCLRYQGELPEHRLLASLQRHFPPPPVAVLKRLNRAIQDAAIQYNSLEWRRLSEMAHLVGESQESSPFGG